MVLPIIDEDARRKSMERCPRFEGCVSPLCPLDPYLKHKVSTPGAPRCYWYDLAIELANFAEIPPCVIDKLPAFIVHLFKFPVLPLPGEKSPR